MVIYVPLSNGHLARAFAAGSLLTMVANSMIPEAYKEQGALVGLMVVLGVAVAAILTLLR